MKLMIMAITYTLFVILSKQACCICQELCLALTLNEVLYTSMLRVYRSVHVISFERLYVRQLFHVTS